MAITVPIGGSNVIPEGEGPSREAPAPSTLSQRKSLHTVRLAAPTAPEYEPQWQENGQLKWVPQAPAEEPAEQVVESTVPRGNEHPDNGAQTQPYDALRQEMAELKQAMQFMTQGQLQPQKPQAPQPPDPSQVDWYDAAQVAEYHRQHDAYVDAKVDYKVNAALDPHRGAMQDAEYARQYNSVYADHGNDPNFKPIMQKALQMVVANGGLTIPAAYDWVTKAQISSPQTAAQPQGYVKPAQRTLTAQEAAQKAAQAQSLPTRNGVSGAAEPTLPSSLHRIDALGRIMFHNQQSGRARPV